MTQITAALFLICGYACGDDDATPDATPPFDAGQDMFEWTSEWRHEPRIEVHDDMPCEPWESVASPLVRALPADTTPRVLWRFLPSEDPNYEGANARFQNRVEAPVVSPDGTIWVRGPTYDQVMQLERDGTMRRWFRAGGADPDDQMNRMRLGPIAVAPNGHLIRVVYAESLEQRGSVARIDPATSDGDGRPESLVVLPEGLGPNSLIAIGPDGMVYVASRNRIYGTCRAERLMWTLTNELGPEEDSSTDSGWFLGVWVDRDGSLLASGTMQRLVRVQAGTMRVEEVTNEDVDVSDYRSLVRFTPDVRLFNLPPGPSGSHRWLIQAAEGDVVVATGGLHNAISPSGVVWLSSSDARLGPRMYPFDMSLGRVETFGPWFEDDSWLARGVTMSRRHFDFETGEEVVDWTLDTMAGSMSALDKDFVIDEAGVGYFVLFGGLGGRIELLAVQLDALPPTKDRCVDTAGCNAQRDRYVRPVAE